MATYDQAMQALRAADKAGNVDDARKLAAIAKRLKPKPAEQPQIDPRPQPDELDNVSSLLDRLIGGAEVAGTMLSGAIAEPVAGVAGIVQSLNPLADTGAGARAVQATRDTLTVKPQTETGKEMLTGVGEAIKPVADTFNAAESGLGDAAFKMTGSPALAAAATSIPTALSELLGVASVKGATKIKAASQASDINKAISESAPTIDQLKDVSRSVYREIDDMGISVSKDAYFDLVEKINAELKSSGLDKDITPNATSALNRMVDRVGENVKLSDLDTLRKVAQNAAKSNTPADSMLGAKMIDAIDEFLDSAGDGKLISQSGDVSEVGKRYKVARDLWGRARRSEMIQEAFEKARNQASGFENGVRVQFRSILNNKKQRRYFTRDELASMTRVVRGDKAENLAKLVGRLGFSEGGATNVVGGAISATLGAMAAGPAGAVLFPIIGQVSRKLAQRMTAKNAEFADQVIRSGKDARKIINAYFQHTPEKLRDPAELSELLLRPDISLEKLPDNVVSIEAAKLAKAKRAELNAAATVGASAQSVAQENK